MAKPAARYASIAADLRDLISNGKLRPGDRLPTEPELRERYGVSRNTARDAVKLLVNEGLVLTRPGRGGGTVVRDRARLTYFASRAEQIGGLRGESDAFFGEAIAQGRAPSQTITVMTTEPPAEIAALLGLGEEEMAVLRRCVRSVDGVKNSLQDSWYPANLADAVPELLRRHDIVQGTTRLLNERGFVQVAYLDQNSARMPTGEEYRLLELEVGTPVFEHRRTGYTADRPLRVSVNIFAGDRTIVAYTLGAGGAIRSDL